MIIRRAVVSDLPGVHEMMESFQAEGLEEYTLGHNRESAGAAAELFIRQHIGVVAIQDDKVIGCLGGCVTEFMLNSDSIVFQEILWYVAPEKRSTGVGIKMLYKTMELAKEVGATHMILAHTGKVLPEMLSKLYGKLGFEVLETQYIRGL